MKPTYNELLKLIEDIMGGKPMGQMEIDEHAAEAGIVTRLEAFVDTIKSYAHTAKPYEVPAKMVRRSTTPLVIAEKALVMLAHGFVREVAEELSSALATRGVQHFFLKGIAQNFQSDAQEMPTDRTVR